MGFTIEGFDTFDKLRTSFDLHLHLHLKANEGKDRKYSIELETRLS